MKDENGSVPIEEFFLIEAKDVFVFADDNSEHKNAKSKKKMLLQQ